MYCFYQFLYCVLMCQEQWYIFFSLFTSVCVVMPLLILIFSGVVFLEKSISMVGLFVCSWFCTISVRDPLDVMELILLNTLNTWRSSLPWNGVTLIGGVTLIDQVPLLKLLQYQSRSVFSLLVHLWKLTTDVWAYICICIEGPVYIVAI